MKHCKKFLLMLVIAALFISAVPINVLAKGGHSSGGHSAGSHSSAHGTNSHAGNTKSAASKTTTSKNISSGGKSFNFSTMKPFKSSTTKTVDTNSKALSNIPKTYSSHSVSNDYYYDTSNGGSRFWSNYWMYRALTPRHRTYVTTGGNSVVAPAYTGIPSAIADIVTLFIIIAIVCLAVYMLKRKKAH